MHRPISESSQLIVQILDTLRISATLWGIVTTHDVQLELIGKRVMDFLDISVNCTFYSASALLAVQSAVLARGILSVRPSVRPSFRHVPVLCPDE